MIRLTWISLLTLSFCLVSPFPKDTFAAPCQSGNQRNSSYMLRKRFKRCEGITTPDVSRSFGFSSLTIGRIKNEGKISLSIPRYRGFSEPSVRITSRKYFYQMDPLRLQKSRKAWEFKWSSKILSNENIPISSLRSLAETAQNRIIIPVMYGNSSNYDFRIHTGNRTQKIVLKVLNSKGKAVSIQTKTDQPGKEVRFSWDGKDQKTKKDVYAGQYTLKVEANIERPNSSVPELRYQTRKFVHNPDWLK